MIGLGLGENPVDCCITKAPSDGDKAGRSPDDRGNALVYGAPVELIAPLDPSPMTAPARQIAVAPVEPGVSGQ
jgi:hypothetical protein